MAMDSISSVANEAAFDTAATRARHLRARYAAEARFKAYGIAAILFGLIGTVMAIIIAGREGRGSEHTSIGVDPPIQPGL